MKVSSLLYYTMEPGKGFSVCVAFLLGNCSHLSRTLFVSLPGGGLPYRTLTQSTLPSENGKKNGVPFLGISIKFCKRQVGFPSLPFFF